MSFSYKKNDPNEEFIRPLVYTFYCQPFSGQDTL